MELDQPRLNILRLIADSESDMANVSKAVGKSHSYLQQYIKRGSPRHLPEDVREALAKFFAVDEALFRSGDASVKAAAEKWGDGGDDRDPPAAAQAPEFNDAISELDIRASAGPGALVESDIEAVIDHWRIPPAVLRNQTASTTGSLKIITVKGDSMAPDFMPGERVLVDTADKLPSPAGVFVLWDGFGLVIKRVEMIPYSNPPMARLISRNSQFQAYECLAEEVQISGRVIGKWHWT
ncbi:S24 family peptidase [Niveispirillum cyanobacteriorum]|uniref:Peptidase S24 n=1 Tax=Niveispirillum cyanobacteriorum TaxID=1612173 RepID=A0A2K9NFX4_9PROT|nr:LexA family transcriptional regulator [Niveispirillum cyanobacteriorum]AUN31978.1 peptidase S24 [Niveispirillum cyanobacteriorum]GGE85240.1 hypothetical protein GCM10011317_48070 [Niveispirillum cyanobacteriorum]